MSDLQFNNYSRFIGENHGKRTFAWCTFLDVGRAVLDTVETVEYILHPTFPDPVRRIDDREHCFALLSSGWGVFTIDIRVHFKDGRTERERYKLRLAEDDWPRGPKMDPVPDAPTKAVYDTLFDERFEWRKMSTIARRSGLAEGDAESILDRLSEQGLVRRAFFISIDNQTLWGATAIVGRLPEPNG